MTAHQSPSTRPGPRIAILQSNYIPWRGYFDIIHDVDLFVFYDDVQYTRRDWRNRNRIKTPRGTEWLSVPTDGDREHLIHEVRLVDPKWQGKHWSTLRHFYGRAPYFDLYREFLEDFYLGRTWTHLSDFNQTMIRLLSHDLLGIQTEFADSRAYHVEGVKHARIMDLLLKTQAVTYVSGPSAKDYLDVQQFADRGIQLVWKDYFGYPEYRQFHPPFDPHVSILDLLFHVGPEAPMYIWGWRGSRPDHLPRASTSQKPTEHTRLELPAERPSLP